MFLRLASLALLSVVAGCGARTDLVLGEAPPGMDATVPRRDAGVTLPPPVDAGLDAAELPDAAEVCPEVDATFGSRQPALLILILDRSGSMRTLFRRWTPMFPSASRWEVVRELLVGSTGGTGLVDDVRARIGLSDYTSSRSECPEIRFVPPALGNTAALREELEAVGPAGGTPTAEAIRDALARVPMYREEDEPVAFLLATDGQPTGCGAGGGEAGVVAATRDAYAEGVRTFVISVGDDVSQAHMQDVANAGLGLAPGEGDAEFWVGRSPAYLSQALREASELAVGCLGRLSRRIRDMDRACEIVLRVGDGEPTCGDLADGYRFPDDRHVQLHGETCRAMRDGMPVTLDAPCGVL